MFITTKPIPQQYFRNYDKVNFFKKVVFSPFFLDSKVLLLVFVFSIFIIYYDYCITFWYCFFRMVLFQFPIFLYLLPNFLDKRRVNLVDFVSKMPYIPALVRVCSFCVIIFFSFYPFIYGGKIFYLPFIFSIMEQNLDKRRVDIFHCGIFYTNILFIGFITNQALKACRASAHPARFKLNTQFLALK